MKKYNVPTAAFETFTDLASAKKFLAEHPAPIVVKASGLAAGKGAIVCMTDKEANDAVEEMLGDKAVFGESGKTVVIEEFMDGEEASIFVVCDGKDYVILSSAQDHKRVFDDDKGPNTGGMGAYSPAPVVTDALLDEVKAKIIEPTLKIASKRTTAGKMEESRRHAHVSFHSCYIQPVSKASLASVPTVKGPIILI